MPQSLSAADTIALPGPGPGEGKGPSGDRRGPWDAFVRSRPDWTHFHLSGWREVLERTFGHECLWLEDRDDDGALTGVLPLVRVKSPWFGHFLVSMPFLNYGGPLGPAGSVCRLAARAVELADRDRVRLLELRSRTPLDIDLPVSNRKVTVLLDLPAGDPDLLWQAFPAKLRSQIRRPRKEGAVVRFGPDQLAPFYDVFSRNMRDLGTPALPRRLFENIRDVFPDSASFGCVYMDDVPVAAGAGFRWGREFELTWASSLRDYNRKAPNMLLYWGLMERGIKEGTELFNFGRCTPGGGTHRFKLQWGGRDETLWWYHHSPRGSAAATPTPDANGAYALGARLWSALPLAVANRLGPAIARSIP